MQLPRSGTGSDDDPATGSPSSEIKQVPSERLDRPAESGALAQRAAGAVVRPPVTAPEQADERLSRQVRMLRLTVAGLSAFMAVFVLLVLTIVLTRPPLPQAATTTTPEPTSSSTSKQPTRSGAPTSTSPGSSESLPATTSAVTTNGAVASWQGSVAVQYEGLDFDLSPVQPGPDTVYAMTVGAEISLNTHVQDISAGNILVAKYEGVAPPSQRQCHDWTEAHAGTRIEMVNPGDMICLVTPKGTTVFIAVKATDSSQESISGDATVWRPQQ